MRFGTARLRDGGPILKDGVEAKASLGVAAASDRNRHVAYEAGAGSIILSLLLSMPHSMTDDAENSFTQSLELSRRQGARAWELRTATDLAAYLASRGRSAEGQALLQPVFERFVEGLTTADLKAGERLLSTLR
jgi:hypothetical protein